MDKLDYCATRNNIKDIEDLENVRFVKGDIQSIDLVSHVLEKEDVDTIMHFAAQVLALSHCKNYTGLLLRAMCLHTYFTLTACACEQCITRLPSLCACAWVACSAHVVGTRCWLPTQHAFAPLYGAVS